MELGLWLIGGAVVIAMVIKIALSTHHARETDEKSSRIRKAMLPTGDFKRQHDCIGADGATGIAVDTNAKKIGLFAAYDGISTVSARIIDYRDLLSAEVVDDSVTVIQETRSGIARALVGGAIFGPIGAVVGAVTAPSTAHSAATIRERQLRLTFNNASLPHFSVLFEKNGVRIPASIDQWFSRMKAIMAEVERDFSMISNVEQNSKSSVISDLERLLALKEKGALSESEFTKEKKRILLANEPRKDADRVKGR